MVEDDPFACFGLDSDDDNEFEQNPQEQQPPSSQKNNNHSEKQRLLIEKSNRRIKSKIINIDDNVATRTVSSLTKSGHSKEMASNKSVELPQALEGWPNRFPLYQGPMIIVRSDNIGGNRGWTATEDLDPGTLLLVEEPIYTWPEVQIGSELGLVSILGLFQRKENIEITNDEVNKKSILWGQEIVWDIEMLHPTKQRVDILCRKGYTNGVEPAMSQNEKVQIADMMELMLNNFSGDPLLSSIMELVKENNVTAGKDSVDKKFLDEIDVLRMLLALRYNGFGSGIYLHFSMFNHAGDSNCIKYIPQNYNSNQRDPLGGSNKNKPSKCYSELRTTKFVKRGETLTLNYIDPREVSHCTRRWHLWDQHRFDIGSGDNLKPSLWKSELVRGVFPQSTTYEKNVHQNAITGYIEKALTDLEDIYRTYSVLISTMEGKEDKTLDGKVELVEQIQALEVSAFELINASITKLENDCHILLIRCYRLHLDSVELLLQAGKSSMNSAQQLDVMCRFLPTSKKLLSLQLSYFGNFHPDVARTYNDMAMAIRGLLSRAPQRLFELKLEKLDNFHQCSIKENEYRNEFKKISRFYPNDVEERLVN